MVEKWEAGEFGKPGGLVSIPAMVICAGCGRRLAVDELCGRCWTTKTYLVDVEAARELLAAPFDFCGLSEPYRATRPVFYAMTEQDRAGLSRIGDQ